MLKKDQTVFVLVDVQGKLARVVHESGAMINQLQRLIKGLQILNIPIIWLEQYPEGLGATIEEVADELSGIEPIHKMTFSGWKNEQFKQAVEATGCQQILVGGIETHICVYQTSAELKAAGYEVQVISDVVSSRTLANKQIGLEKMKALDILMTSVEMALYELLESADTAEFKEILKVIK
ncbi:hydrolase [Bacillus sp. FJAT-52991]|uniref:Hydrolase n=1 Tax=Bacillus kandeliae TaxID=3129297 RepID=A0ABZ2N7T7_9BACI